MRTEPTAPTTSVDQTAVATVRSALRAVPDAGAVITEKTDEFEHSFDVAPVDSRHCPFWLGIGTYGTYGLGFGHGLCFEDLSIEDFPPDRVVRAILDGKVRETVWFWKKRAVKANGAIALGDGQELSDTMYTPFGWIGRRSKVDIRYDLYPMD